MKCIIKIISSFRDMSWSAKVGDVHTHELHSHNRTGSQPDAMDIALVSRHEENRDAEFWDLSVLSGGKGIKGSALI